MAPDSLINALECFKYICGLTFELRSVIVLWFHFFTLLQLSYFQLLTSAMITRHQLMMTENFLFNFEWTVKNSSKLTPRMSGLIMIKFPISFKICSIMKELEKSFVSKKNSCCFTFLCIVYLHLWRSALRSQWSNSSSFF